MEKYKEDFIKFMVKCDALKFGKFTLKSGRVAPYFINSGMFNDGEKIRVLGEYYSKAIKENFGSDFDGIFGPAYKGIPLCISAAIGLEKMGMKKGYVFNRKEPKDYALKDNLIGMQISSSTSLILIDDVITAGTAIRQSLEILEKYGNPKIKGIIVSVDRQEKGTSEKNALKQTSEELGVPIFSIVTLSDIIHALHNKKIDGVTYIDDAMKEKIDNYLEQYGAK